MKKLFCGTLAVCLLIITASADILWEPESSFYKRHAGDCEMEQRRYWVNSPEGYTTVWDEPNGVPVANIPNGALLYVYYRYQGSAGDWGIVEYSSDALRETAVTLNEAEIPENRWVGIWVPMEDLVNYYDHQSFLEEHSGEVQETKKTVDLSGLRYCTYEYPGGAFKYQPEEGFADLEITVSCLYTDSEGREWGYTGYFYGDRNVWFCISDPENPNLSAEDHQPELYPAITDSPELPAAGTGTNVSVWVILSVAALCGVTAILIFRMRKKKGTS